MAAYKPSEDDWDTYGMMFAASRFTSRLASVALWGIQAFMALYGISTFLNMSAESRRGRLRFLFFGCGILLTNSIHLVLNNMQVFRNLFRAGPDGRSYIAAFRKDSEDTSLRCSMLIDAAMNDATIILGNTILLWRCYMVWRSKRWIIILPSLAYTGTIKSLSVSMDVVVTGLILFQLSRTWSIVSKAYPNRQRPRMYSNVAALVIESAIPITIFGICYVTLTAIACYGKPEIVLAKRGTFNALTEASACLYNSFSALSPQMIIFRVLNGQLWKDSRESGELLETFSQPIRFAVSDSILTEDA
ncbi:hypothetical protein BKA70DRAFT_1423009 [Coprinopsis sp. MPI-PUGE-AT-0042]|nr:hypothetical protein BKA70DRAFT_1423009 [Coprinopsis sp. MPI-PUGE-AT-0042]